VTLIVGEEVRKSRDPERIDRLPLDESGDYRAGEEKTWGIAQFGVLSFACMRSMARLMCRSVRNFYPFKFQKTFATVAALENAADET